MVTFVGVFNVLGFTAPLFDDAPPLGGFAFLFLLQLLSGFFTQQQLSLIVHISILRHFKGM